MKKTKIIIVLFCLLAIGRTTTYAQSALKLGVTYLDNMFLDNTIAGNIVAQLDLINKDNFSVSVDPGLVIGAPKYTNGYFQLSANASLRGKFLEKKLEPYIGIGPAFHLTLFEFLGKTDSHTELGLNFGLGANAYITDRFGIFGDLRFVSFFDKDIRSGRMYTVGVCYRIGKN